MVNERDPLVIFIDYSVLFVYLAFVYNVDTFNDHPLTTILDYYFSLRLCEINYKRFQFGCSSSLYNASNQRKRVVYDKTSQV